MKYLKSDIVFILVKNIIIFSLFFAAFYICGVYAMIPIDMASMSFHEKAFAILMSSIGWLLLRSTYFLEHLVPFSIDFSWLVLMVAALIGTICISMLAKKRN